MLEQFNLTGKTALVTGYDDSPTAQHIWPALTSVKQPVVELAQMAASLLISKVKNRAVGESKPVLNGKLVLRESTGELVSAR